MSIIEKIRMIRRYVDQHTGVRLKEFWLTEDEVTLFKRELEVEFGGVMVPIKPGEPYHGKFEFHGMTIKTIGVHDRLCEHPLTSHFRDVNEIYCHDCRTIIGTGEPETHKRNSTI